MKSLDVAYYKYKQFLVQWKGQEFDDLHEPGENAPLSGIYRCEGCGTSVVGLHGAKLPGNGHHEHADEQPMLWRLIVCSHYK